MNHTLYTIGHLTQFTGLTDRTIRAHIAAGYLQGQKINGIWHFTPEQAESYIRHKAVTPSILSKANGIVYDFLLNDHNSQQEQCVILDLPGQDPKIVGEFFCYNISSGPYSGIRFSFQALTQVPRIILSGPADQVQALIGAWFARTGE